jgi:hypothetical protein
MPRWHDLSDGASLSREAYWDGFEERIAAQAKLATSARRQSVRTRQDSQKSAIARR